MFDGSECISGKKKKAFTGVDKFPSRSATFWGTQKMGGLNQSVRPIKTRVETCFFFCSLLPKPDFQLSF